MEPASVGVPESRLVLGKHSGRHALRKRCEDLGFTLDRPTVDALYRRFTALADRKKGVTDEEIARLVRIETGEEQEHVEEAPGGPAVVVAWPEAGRQERPRRSSSPARA
jgi:2-isopropylmalate synthase